MWGMQEAVKTKQMLESKIVRGYIEEEAEKKDDIQENRRKNIGKNNNEISDSNSNPNICIFVIPFFAFLLFQALFCSYIPSATVYKYFLFLQFLDMSNFTPHQSLLFQFSTFQAQLFEIYLLLIYISDNFLHSPTRFLSFISYLVSVGFQKDSFSNQYSYSFLIKSLTPSPPCQFILLISITYLLLKIQFEYLIANIIPMLKTKTTSNYPELFVLSALAQDCHIKNINVNFQAPFNLNKTSNSIVPAFFGDRNYYTPAFILPREKVENGSIQEYYDRNGDFERLTFEEKVLKIESTALLSEEEKEEKISMYSATPQTKNCQICKEGFENYWDHIQQKYHLNRISENTINQHISQLCNKYRKKGVRKEEKRKCVRKNRTKQFVKKKQKINNKKQLEFSQEL